MLFVQKPGVSLYDDNIDGEEKVSVSIDVLLQDISSYDSFFLVMLRMGLGVGMVVSIFLRGSFLVERMLDFCACMWLLTVSSEIVVYLVTLFTINSVNSE